MVILIGGSSHVGKSVVAKGLVKKYGHQCINLDHLKTAFLRSQLGQPGDRNDYQMRYWMWPFVSEIIRHAIESGQNLIVEGCYIPSEWAQSFSDEELKSIRCVFIIMNENYLRTHFDDIAEYSQVVERRKEDPLDLDRLINCSNEFREECLKTGTYYIEIAGEYDPESLFDAVDAVIEDADHVEKALVL